MMAAIFGLIGVIVGGLLNAAVTAWQTRRADVADGRLAARVVAVELREADTVLTLIPGAAAEEAGREQLSSAAWVKHREVLARTLSDQDWEAVAEAYEVIEGSYAHALERATAPKADPHAPGSPTRPDVEIVREAAGRMHKLGKHSTLERRLG